MSKNNKFTRRIICTAAALCMTLSLSAPVMYTNAAVPESEKYPMEEASAVNSRSLKDELAKTGNKVTEYVNEDDHKHKTILWAKGITPPTMGGPDSDFERKPSTEGGEKYVTYEAPYVKGNGWYDVNKNGDGDASLCFAAAAANSLHWWMDRNSGYIDRYLEKNPDNLRIQRVKDLRHSFESQTKSGVFDIFLQQFKDRKEGYWSDLLQDQFINGYPLRSGGGTNSRPIYAEELLQKGPDKHGGFFYEAMGTELLSYRRYYDSAYNYLGNDLKEHFMQGDIVLLSFQVFPTQSHVITLWGAEYDDNGSLSAVYYTDSDDEHHIGMQRYRIVHVGGGKAVVSNRLENKGTNYVESVEFLSPGTARWEEYFKDDQITLELTWSNTVHTYDGKPHAPTVTATDPVTHQQVELAVQGEGINAGSYTATAAFKDGGDAKYKLPENPTCKFEIKKAPAPNITYPNALPLQYGQFLSDSTLTGGSLEYGSFFWANGSLVPSAGTQSYPVIFTPSQMTQQNYEAVQNTQTQVPVQVEKAVPAVTLNAQVQGEADALQATLSASISSVGYGEMPSGSVSFTILDENGQSVADAPIEAVLNGNGTASAVWKPTQSKNYRIQATYSGNGNYASASAEMPINVSQQTQKPIVIQPIENKTYGDGPFEIVVEGGSGSGSLAFTSSASDVVSVTNGVATIHKAGTAVITVTKQADGLYGPAQASVPVTVDKKVLTVTAESKADVMQGDPMPTFTYKVEGLVNGDQFSNPDFATVPQDTNTPGDYEIAISGGLLSNAESYTVTYVSGKLTILPAPEPEPDPDPDPDPNPNPNPNPDPSPNPNPNPDPSPDPNPNPNPDPNPDPSPDPDPNPNPDPSPDPDPNPNPDPSPDPDPNPNPDPSPDPNPNPNPDSNPNPKPDPDPESTPDSKPIPDSERPQELPSKPVTKPEGANKPATSKAPLRPAVTEKGEQQSKPEENKQTEENTSEKQEPVPSTEPEVEKETLPETTSVTMPTESTATTPASSTGSTVVKVIVGTAVALAAISGGVVVFRRRKAHKR